MVLLAALSLLLIAPTAGASEALRPTMTEMSKQIARFLKGRNEQAIAVGSFTGPSLAMASSGPGMNKVLIEELQKQGVEVRRSAPLEIKGDYRSVENKDDGLLVLRIRSHILDRAGDVLLELDKRLHDRNVLAQVLGMNKPDLGDGLSPQRESTLLVSLIEEPKVHPTGSRLATTQGSPYAIEILIRQGARFVPQPVAVEEGLPFVRIGRGEAFAVRLINDSGHAAAVELTLDGLSAFAFSENPSYRHFIIPARGSGLIKGWHRTNENSDEFLVTRYTDGAVAELLSSPDQVGTITASFAAAWRPQDPRPRDEGTKFRDPFGNAVGRGQPVRTPYQEVRMERGRIRDVISVRYQRP